MFKPVNLPADPSPPGSNCLVCTPALFPTGEWPLWLYATFQNILPCPGHPAPPLDYPFKLIQSLVPCYYQCNVTLSGKVFRVTLDLDYADLTLMELSPTLRPYFYAVEPACSLTFPVNSATCPSYAGYQGQGFVTPTPRDVAATTAHTYGFMPLPGGYADHREVAVDHQVLTIVNKRDNSRCLFYIDRQELPPV